MRVRSKFLLLLAIAALFTSACTSTTVVARDNRTVADPESQSDDGDDSDSGSASSDSADDEAVDDDSSDTPDADPTPAPPRAIEEDSGFGAGGDEQIQGMVDDCEAGSDLACDILFQISAFDSVEETIALTCGGRSDTDVLFCTEGVDANEDDTAFDIESEALAGLATACEDGDMTSCDFLFYRSPVASDYEALGNSCGGRTSVALPDCRTLFADS